MPLAPTGVRRPRVALPEGLTRDGGSSGGSAGGWGRHLFLAAPHTLEDMRPAWGPWAVATGHWSCWREGWTLVRSRLQHWQQDPGQLWPALSLGLHIWKVGSSIPPCRARRTLRMAGVGLSQASQGP